MARSDTATGQRHSGSGLAGLVAALGLGILFGGLPAALLYLVLAPGEEAEDIAEWHARLSAMADDRKAAIDQWLRERRADATVVADFPAVSALLRARQRTSPSPAQLETRTQTARILATVTSTYGYRWAKVVDGNGELVASTDAATLDAACRDAARRAVAGGLPFIDVHAHGDGSLAISAVAPAHATPHDPSSPSGEVVGAVLLEMDPSLWLYPFLASEPAPTATGETVLMREENGEAVFVSPLRLAQKPDQQLRKPLDTPGFAAADALAGREACGAYVDYRNVPILAATRTLAEAPMGLVVKVDRDEAMAGHKAWLRSMTQSGGIVILALVAAGVGLWQARIARMRASLVASQARLGMLMDHANDAIIFVARDGRIREANRRAEEMYGFLRPELVGKSVLTDLRPPESQPAGPGQIEQALAQGELTFETVHRHANGRAFPVEVSTRKVELEGDQVMLSVVRDITARRRAEAATEASAQRYRELVESMASCVAVYEAVDDGEDFVFVEFNYAAERTEGVSRHDVLGRRVTEVFPGVGEFGILDVFRRVWRSGEPEHFPVKEYKDDRIVGWRDNYIYKLPTGEVVAVYEDVTARMRAEEELRRSHDLMARVTETSPVGIVTLDPSGFLLSANRTAEEILGLTRSDIATRTYDAPEWRITSFDGGPFRDEELPFHRVMATGQAVYGVEHAIEHPDGRRLYLAINAAPLFDAAGAIQRVIATLNDVTSRVDADQALRESETRFRDLVENLNDVIFRVSVAGEITYVSPTVTRIFGYAPEELVGRSYTTLVHSDDLPAIRTALQDILAGNLYPREYRFHAKDGTIRWVRTSSRPFQVDGGVVGIQGVLTDISERRQAEEALKSSEARLRSTLRVAPIGIGVVVNRILLDVNDRFLEITGYPRDELVGQSARVVYPSDEEYEWVGREKYRQIAEQGTGTVETRFRRKDGKLIDVLLSSTPLDPGDLTAGVTFTALDITERKQAEQALRESEKRFRLFYEKAPVAYQSLDEQGIIREVNQAWLAMMGLPRVEVIGRGFGDFLTPEDVDSFHERYAEFKAAGETRDAEFNLVSGDGSLIVTSIDGTVARGADGKFQQTHCVLHDITVRASAEKERLRLVDQIRGLARQVAETEEAERRRLARELHDRVGQTLTALGLNLNLVKSQLGDHAPPEVSARLGDSLDLLSQTSDEVRDVMAELRPPVLDEYGLPAALRWYAERFGQRTGIAVTVAGDDMTPRPRANVEASLFRIAQEALTNVAKHANAQSVKIAVTQDDGAIRLEVADDGGGFDPGAAHGPEASSGWGLVGMRERAEAIGGRLRIDSAPGRGTRVIIELGVGSEDERSGRR